MASTTHNAPETHTGVKLPVLKREKLILNGRSYHWITERICGVVENKHPTLAEGSQRSQADVGRTPKQLL